MNEGRVLNLDDINDYINNEFFIIDSENLNSINSKLFGFSIYDGNIVYDADLNDDIRLSGDGTYVRILKTQNKIQISQDFNGSYGIYLYKHQDIFVISNSFLKLVDYVKDRYPISFNEDVAYSFMAFDLCSLAYRQTMINEIEVINRNCIINIDIPDRSLDFEMIDYNENRVPIDSQEGIALLDEWFYKWVSMFRNLKKETNSIQVDLTGGFDTRIILTILLNANIDLNQILINSKNTEKYKEDYEIASIMAEKYNFSLNKQFFKNLIKINDVHDSILFQYYAKLCFHEEFAFPNVISINPIYVIGGSGGESLRGYWSMSPEQRIADYTKQARKISDEFVKPVENVLTDAFKQLQKDFNIKDETSKRLTELLYREVRNRNHFGKNSVNYYLTNQIQLSPLIDVNLFKIRKEDFDENLLFAVIFTRYCPELLNIKFDNGKSIKDDIINEANDINSRYPFERNDLDFITESKAIEKNCILNNKGNRISADEYIKKVFLSDSFRDAFETYFSSELYQKILLETETLSFQPLRSVNKSIAILKIIEYVKLNDEKFPKKPKDRLNTFLNRNINKLYMKIKR